MTAPFDDLPRRRRPRPLWKRATWAGVYLALFMLNTWLWWRYSR